MVISDHTIYQELAERKDNKIVLLVMDGLGGLPMQPNGLTELEAAYTPHLDRLAREGSSGRSIPVRPGMTPGSGPAHLALFSYDPVQYAIGRGVLEALGIGFELGPNDLAARGNFATVDEHGRVVDRRAGRISTEECVRLTKKLQENTSLAEDGVEVFVMPVKEHRFAVVFRGEGLGGELTETDPLVTGKPPLPVEDLSGTPEGQRTAALVNKWIAQARAALADERRANSLNLRGIAKDPGLPSLQDIFKLRPAAIAVYPMYKGVAKLVGMTVIDFEGDRPHHEIAALKAVWKDYDFFFIHIKKTDSYGEDGNFDAKVHEIEAVDALIPDILALNPSVLIVTGDHSTPAKLRNHSSHPVPTLFWGPNVMQDSVTTFGERASEGGAMGLFHATEIIPWALGYADRLKRFGA
ncbi:MAG TPA: 2,3-bisphosphoglycerate-independent phosphoglycerate mutase [Anaerolineae bacterium]|nr:2,3-bisphosphoglycerate-independent phosphoglycerate mutase [Caldilineae bacterium]HID34093.1 2,3-bisphosphoglycerate-independent phosphoglycerate mutase [Anaerolineae bacterium]HIQ11334.1 2,3-bisphosphoglycerate-independent phosphoglycerate mutase [Caldilineales bacterium]